MAHNAYFPSQTPLGQQAPIQPRPGPSPAAQQYAQHPQQQYYQQPQNIYQQLGQAQPQPHLQRLYQHQQGQYAQQPPPPAQQGGYAQQQSHGFVQQRPLSTSFQPPQHGYAPSTTPFQQPPPPPQQQQQPYPSPTQQYVPSQYGSTLQQPQRGPISRTPSAQGFAPTNAYAGQGYMNQAPAQELNPPPMSSMMAQQQQRRSPQPPPPAPSALIAQQTMVQRRPSMAPSGMSQGHPQMQPQMQPPMQMQMRQQPPPQQQQQQPPPQSHVMQMQQRHSLHMPSQQMQQHSQFAQQIQQNNPVGSRRPLPQLSPEDPHSAPIGLARSGTTASRPLSMPPPINTSNSFSAFNREPSPLEPPLGQPMSASSIPPPSFVQRQIQQIQAMQAQKQQQQQQQAAGMSTSPSSSMPPRPPSAMGSTRSGSRPLPAAPGSQAAKRNTVDLGSVGKVSGLPNVNGGSGFGFGASPISNSSSASTSTSNSEGPSEGASPSKAHMGIGKGFPSTAPLSGNFGNPRPVSRTTVMAASQSNGADNETTPKRPSGRASPPRFSKSISSSPTKEDAKPTWTNNSTSNKPSSIFSGGAKNVSTPDLGSPSIRGPLTPGSIMSTTTSSTSQQKKFTPVWKRTIPDYPSPVFGYAAGMVADPFAKPPLSANPSSASIANKANDTTPKANKVLSEKERKKLEKEEKKRAKEEEKMRKKMAKKGMVVGTSTTTPVKSTVSNAMGASTSGGGSSPSQLPYLNPTPPRAGGAAPGAFSRAFEHGQHQHQHMMNRGAVVGQGSSQTTPTRQIQVRGQPTTQPAPTTPGGTSARYTMPLARQESTEGDDDDDDDEDEEDDEEDDDEDDDDVEKAYRYEGSDYSEETSEQDYAPPNSRKALEQQRNKQEEEMQYREYLIQQQMAQAKQSVHKKAASGSSPGRQYREDDGYEHRPSPSSRHAKSKSSASDGYVVVGQAYKNSANGGSRPSHSRAQSYSTNAYENSEEDDWEKLQAYESSPHRATPKARAKSRRYREEEEEDEDEEDEEEAESAEEELRRRYMAKRRRERDRAKAEAEALAQAEEEEEERVLQERASRHRREISERDVPTVRKYQREPDYDVKTAKQAVPARVVREKVEDIDWDRQDRLSHAQNGITRKYQQQLKRGDEEEEDGGRGREKVKVKKRASLRDMFSSRSRSKPRYAEQDEEEEEEEEEDEFPKRKGAKKIAQPPKKLVKKTSKRHVSQSEPESVDSESVETTVTEDSAASRLANKFKASVMKFSGSQSQKASQHQKTPSQPQQSQSQRQSGFSPPGSGSLYFGILDDPPQVSSPVSTKPPLVKATSSSTSTPQAAAPSRVRGEVTRSRVNLKADTLDDPPPRSLRTPSPSPGSANPRRQSMYQYSNEAQPRQTDFHQRPRPQSQIYSATPKSNFTDNMQHSRVGGPSSEITQPKRRELPQPSSRSRPQSQSFPSPQNSMSFDAATGLPVHHQQAMQGYAPPPQLPLSRPPSQRQLQQQYNNQSVPSTPRQQQPPITIESPAPLKMANILQMEEDGAAEERRQQEYQHQQQFQSQQNVPLINVHSTGQQQQFQSRPPSVPSINVQQTGGHQNQQPFHHQNHSQGNIPSINVGSPPESAVSSPRIGVHHTGRTDMTNGTQQMIPIINFDNMQQSPGMPSVSVNEAPSNSPGGGSNGRQVFEVPGISVSGQFDEGPANGAPQISISVSGDGGSDHGQNHHHNHNHGSHQHQHQQQQQPQQARFVNNNARPTPARSGTGGLICGGCQGPIVGRIVSAMGMRWHPNCFKCSVCSELLEHVSSYEHDGRPYCHLDYHENFAPRCYSCKTPIIEEQFISLDDPALGKRTYHMEHFFCAECGDPFLTPSMSNTSGELALSGDGDFEGFTVYKGHPYCEACHVRLRLPKCKKCKKSIRDHDRAVEALGGKWCWSCFVCEGCSQPFEDPSFFQRDGHPFCEHCFSVILRNEM